MMGFPYYFGNTIMIILACVCWNTHAIFHTFVSGTHGFRVDDEPNEPEQSPKHDALCAFYCAYSCLT